MGGGGPAPRPGRITSGERPGTNCTGGWVGPRPGLDRRRKYNPPPGFDPRTVQPVASRYTDWAIPAAEAASNPCKYACESIRLTFHLKKLCKSYRISIRDVAMFVYFITYGPEATMYTTWCNAKKICFLPTHCIHVFCMAIINNSHYFRI